MMPSKKIPPEEWGAENRSYPETAGIPGKRNPFLTSYMVPWTHEIWEGKYSRFVAVTGAQSGKTENILDAIGARLDQKPAPILYVGPTKEFLTDQFEPRLMGLLDQADSLKGKVVRGRRMKKTLKIVAGVPVRLAHAGSSTALKSDPAALAFIDEYDEMNKSVRGQGDVLGLVEARGITYADFVTAITSTPSAGTVHAEFDAASGLEFWGEADPEDLTSPIWRLWQEGTRYHYAWPCPHCDDYFIPRFKWLRWNDKATPTEAKMDTTIECPCCHALIEHKHKDQMNARGVYVAPGQRVEKDGTVVGDPPNSSTYSVWISGLASPFVSWGERVEKYLTALNSADPDRIQTAMNAQFGELFSINATGDAPEWQVIMNSRLPSYRMNEVPEGVLRIVMGVDVQKYALYYTIRGFGARATSWLLEANSIHGKTDEDGVWNILGERMLTPFGEHYIERVLIDSGFRPNKADVADEHKVYEFCRKYQWLAFPTKGRDTMTPPYRVSKIESKPDGKRASYSINLVMLSSDFFKSLVMSRLGTEHGQPGSFYLPDDVSEDYCRQVVSEVRTVNHINSKPVWVKRSRNNHYLDCEALCAAAAHTLNVQRIPEAASASLPPPGDASVSGNAPVPPPSVVGGAVSNRNRFAGFASRFNR